MTRRTYTRDDVETHSDNFGPSRPAVNVKVYTDIRDAWDAFAKDEEPDARFSLDWIEEHVADDTIDAIFWHVAAAEFEYLADYAPEILGDRVAVHQEGRSGGWAVVDGLPELEDWDAVRLGKWRRFERIAKEIARGVPYQMLGTLYLNQFERWADETEDASVSNSEIPVDQQKQRARLEELRAELRAERISYGELAELQTLVEFIDPGDVELLEAAGVPEHA